MMLSNLVGQIVGGPVYKIKKATADPTEKPCAKGCGRPRMLLASGRYQSYCKECNIQTSKDRYRKLQQQKKEEKQ